MVKRIIHWACFWQRCKRLNEAAEALSKAVNLLPDRVRVRYNYALVLQHLGQKSEAETEMLKAHQVDELNSRVVHALTIFYIQQGQLKIAQTYAQKLIKLVPGAPGPQQLLQQIQRELSN